MSENRTEEGRRRTYGRSPPFPFIPLGKAVDRLHEFDTHSRGHPLRVPIALSAWGYGEKSSGGAQTLAALKAFGLMTELPDGEHQRVQVSETGKRLLRSPPESVRMEILKKAALTPKLISEFWGPWGCARPPDAECLWTLRDQRGFTTDAAMRFISVYDDTLRYAGLAQPGNMTQGQADVHEDIGTRERSEPEDTLGQSPLPPPVAARKREGELMEGERELTTGLLSKNASFRLIVTGKVGEKEIKLLIRKLELDKEILAEADEVPTDLKQSDDDPN